MRLRVSVRVLARYRSTARASLLMIRKGLAARHTPHSGPKIRSIPLTSAINALNILLGAVTGVLVARFLGAAGRGELVIGSIGPLFIGSLSTMGLEESTVYMVANAETRTARRTVLWSSLTAGLLSGALGSLVALAVQIWYFAPRASSVGGSVLLSYALLPVFYTVTQIRLAAMRALGEYLKWNVCRLSVSLLYAVSIILLGSVNNISTSSVLLSHLMVNAALAIVLLAGTASRSSFHFDLRIATSLIRLGLSNHLVTIQQISNQRLDQFIMARIVSPASLGRYAVAVTYATAGLSLALAPSWQLYSHLSRNSPLSRPAFRRVLRRSAFAVTGMALAGTIAAPYVLPALFGSEFKEALLPSAILLFASPALAVSALYASTWKACGAPARVAKAEAIGLAMTILLLVVLVPAWGVTGAAIASFFAYGLVALLLARGPLAPSVV